MEELHLQDKLLNLYHENKLSHVYLIETNNIDKCFNELLVLIKKINCQDNYQEKCDKCNLCNLTDQFLLPSLIVIEPDGINIKKEQVLDLKMKFATMPTITNNNFYIIKNAEKLNKASANTMLKFVEEPNDAIIGFFIASNINFVIPTIRSRCQIINVNYQEDEMDVNSDVFKVAKEYINRTELKKEEKILVNKDVLLAKFSERQDVENVFKTMLNIYLSVLNEEYFPGNNDFSFLKQLNKNSLLKRIKLITKVLDDINYNANIELLLDGYIIELGDIDEIV